MFFDHNFWFHTLLLQPVLVPNHRRSTTARVAVAPIGQTLPRLSQVLAKSNQDVRVIDFWHQITHEHRSAVDLALFRATRQDPELSADPADHHNDEIEPVDSPRVNRHNRSVRSERRRRRHERHRSRQQSSVQDEGLLFLIVESIKLY